MRRHSGKRTMPNSLPLACTNPGRPSNESASSVLSAQELDNRQRAGAGLAIKYSVSCYNSYGRPAETFNWPLGDPRRLEKAQTYFRDMQLVGKGRNDSARNVYRMEDGYQQHAASAGRGMHNCMHYRGYGLRDADSVVDFFNSRGGKELPYNNYRRGIVQHIGLHTAYEASVEARERLMDLGGALTFAVLGNEEGVAANMLPATEMLDSFTTTDKESLTLFGQTDTGRLATVVTVDTQYGRVFSAFEGATDRSDFTMTGHSEVRLGEANHAHWNVIDLSVGLEIGPQTIDRIGSLLAGAVFAREIRS